MNQVCCAKLSVRLRSWNAWASGLLTLADWQSWASSPHEPRGSNLPPLSNVPPLLKRRLSNGGRAAFEVALNCVPPDELDKVQLVFASRHGESATTERLLESIGRRDKLSPNDFSLSVHNSAVGLFSIFTKNRLPSQALAARTGTFAAGILEAALRIHQFPDTPVLLAYSDEQIPEKFVTDTQDVFPLHGLGLLFSSKSDDGICLEISFRGEKAAVSSSRLPQQLEFLHQILDAQSSKFELALGAGTLTVECDSSKIGSLWRLASTPT